ncbi:MAG: glycosyltransferase, partial [Cytophagia bacterium]|nr:glycosyltransferase [Cytophagia bacterium]
MVCAHDELENLQVLVPLLLQQAYPNFEVIVVDDRSNDATLDWLLNETKIHPGLRMVHVDHTPDHINGKKYALTLGIRAAKHDWIVLTDADCRPASPDWLKGLSEGIGENTEIILGYSPYQKKEGWLNRFIRFESLITALQYLGFALLKKPYMGVGRNMAYRKSLFMNNKGFTNMLSYTGGDDDLFVNKHAKGSNTSVVMGEH